VRRWGAGDQSRSLDEVSAGFADQHRSTSGVDERADDRPRATGRDASEVFLAFEIDRADPGTWLEGIRPALLTAGVDPFPRTTRLELNIDLSDRPEIGFDRVRLHLRGGEVDRHFPLLANEESELTLFELWLREGKCGGARTRWSPSAGRRRRRRSRLRLQPRRERREAGRQAPRAGPNGGSIGGD